MVSERFVLGASVTAAWCFRNEGSVLTTALLEENAAAEGCGADAVACRDGPGAFGEELQHPAIVEWRRIIRRQKRRKERLA